LHLQWSQGVQRPKVLADIGPLLPQGITYAANDSGDKNRANATFFCTQSITIGAATTLENIRQANLPLLSEAARDVAAPNIRRLATLGGTIGFGAGCLLPALLVMNAQVTTTEGQQPLAAYLSSPSGIILSITITPAQHHIWRKTGLRAAFTPSIIVSAGALNITDDVITACRLAVGGGVVAPNRLNAVEDWLIGQRPDDLDHVALCAQIEQNIQAPSCAFRSAAYRARVAANALAYGILAHSNTSTAIRRPARPLPRPDAKTPPASTTLSRSTGGDRWHTRPDMPTKARGTQPYLTDHREDGMLVARILRAAHPHAKILSIDTTAAQALSGVHAVITHKDVLGLNGFGIVIQDQPAFCSDKVRYIGDTVAAVAADTAGIAEAALALIKVEYEVLPLITDLDAALLDDAPQIHSGSNTVNEVKLERGDVDTAFALAAHVIEDTYVTPRQMHGFMETEGGWAAPDKDGLLICVGGQHGARDRLQLSRILNMPEDKLRIITSPIGGGFGGKDELTVQPALALLAQKTGQKVRLHLSRAESVVAGTKRNPMRIRMRTACDSNGILVAQQVDLVSDCGAYASLSPAVMETAMEHCAGPYEIPNMRTRGRTVYTNNGVGGAFRGFGSNQMTFAVECQLDRLAQKVGQDPATMRRINLRVPGTPGYLGQKIAPSERLHEMLDAAQASKLWHDFDVQPDEVSGVGMALVIQGTGLGTLPEDTAHFALRLRDGKIEALCGLDEMGQGLIVSLHAAVSDKMGCGRDDIRAIFGDTGRAPDSGSTTAARGGYVVWRGVEDTAPALATKIIAAASHCLGLPPAQLKIVPGGVGDITANTPVPLLSWSDLGDLDPVETFFEFPKTDYTKGNARFIFTFGSTLARVAVNRITGTVRIAQLELHTAAGPVIDMAAYLGQMEGALVQGTGMTLTEDAVMQDGQMVTKNFDTYVMPSVRDIPDKIDVTAHETLDAGDPFGPRGVGELGITGVTAAVANAVADAIGHWPTVTPFPPEDILAMMTKSAQT
jgi:CO/xanthine dehydrogenase Mo-binding subunit/CO/xanthine dehydrogenase FAD-binding subunit